MRFLKGLISGREEGQLVVLAAFTMVVALAFAALAIDIGQFLHTKTKLQADVDAMALGGAQKLCGTEECNGYALADAEELRGLNGLGAAEGSAHLDLTCSNTGITENDKITARAVRHNTSFVAQVVGFTGTDIVACATAGKYSLGGANGLVPFAIEDDCLAAGEYGVTYNLKYDSDTDDVGNPACEHSRGNFAALAIDASGNGPGCSQSPSDEEELKFKRALCFGANRGICVVDAIECAGEADDDSCQGDPVAAYEICTEPGVNAGAVKEGLDYRIDETSSECDTWEEVAFPDGGGLTSNCDPWIAGGPASLRVIMIPVVDGLWDDGGRHKITVVSFAIFFLEDSEECDQNGNCDVVGRFVKTQMHTGGLGYASLDPDSAITLVKLLD